MPSPPQQPGQQRQLRSSRRGMLDNLLNLRSHAGLAASLFEQHGPAIATAAAVAGWAMFLLERARVARLQRRLAEEGRSGPPELSLGLSKRSSGTAAPAADACPPTEHAQVHAALQQRLLEVRQEVAAADAQEQRRQAAAETEGDPTRSSPELLAAAEQDLMDLQAQLESLQAEIQSCTPSRLGSPTRRTRDPDWYTASLRGSGSSSPQRPSLSEEEPLLGMKRWSRNTSMAGFAQRLAPLELGAEREDRAAAGAAPAVAAAQEAAASLPSSPDVFRMLCSQADMEATTWLVDATVAPHRPEALLGPSATHLGSSGSPTGAAARAERSSPLRMTSSPPTYTPTYRFHLLGLLSPRAGGRSVASTPGGGSDQQQLGLGSAASAQHAQRSWSMPNSPSRLQPAASAGDAQPRAAASAAAEQLRAVVSAAVERAMEGGAAPGGVAGISPSAAAAVEAGRRQLVQTAPATKQAQQQQQQGRAMRQETPVFSRSPSALSDRGTPLAASLVAAGEGQWRLPPSSKIPKLPPSHPGTPTGFGSPAGTPTTEGAGGDFRISSVRASSCGLRPSRTRSANSSPAGMENAKLTGRQGLFSPADASSRIPKPAGNNTLALN